MQCAYSCDSFIILHNGTQNYTKILDTEWDSCKHGLLKFWRIFTYTNEYFTEIHQAFLIFISKSTSIRIHATFTHPKEEKKMKLECTAMYFVNWLPLPHATCVNIMLFGTLFSSLDITVCFIKWFEIVFKQCETYLEAQCVCFVWQCHVI